MMCCNHALFTFLLFIFVGRIFCNIVNLQPGDVANEIKTKNVLVLYVTEDCDICDTWEDLLIDLYSDIRSTTDVSIVKVTVPAADISKYGVEETPFMMYHHLESSTPLLIDFIVSDDELVKTLSDAKWAPLHYLDDQTFEHDTQAATGSTTGSWLVYFTPEECDLECQLFMPKLKFLAARYRNSVNVAVANPSKSRRTIKRFNMSQLPMLTLFQHGKMLIHDAKDHDSTNLHAFVTKEHPEDAYLEVPQETPEILEKMLDFLELLFLWKGTIFICVFSLVFCYFAISYHFKLKALKKPKGKKQK